MEMKVYEAWKVVEVVKLTKALWSCREWIDAWV